MNAHRPSNITPAPVASPCANADIPAAYRVPLLITTDARKVSSRDFLDLVTGRSDEIRAAEREQSIRQCIRRIELGLSLYGYPPLMVAECRQIMADEDSGWLLAERSYYGMAKL